MEHQPASSPTAEERLHNTGTRLSDEGLIKNVYVIAQVRRECRLLAGYLDRSWGETISHAVQKSVIRPAPVWRARAIDYLRHIRDERTRLLAALPHDSQSRSQRSRRIAGLTCRLVLNVSDHQALKGFAEALGLTLDLAAALCILETLHEERHRCPPMLCDLVRGRPHPRQTRSYQGLTNG